MKMIRPGGRVVTAGLEGPTPLYVAKINIHDVAQVLTAMEVGLFLAVVVAGCGVSSGNGKAGATSDAQMESDVPVQPMESEAQGASLDGNTCNVVVVNQPNDGHGHTAQDCDPVTYASNPPSSGTHYPDWAEYKTYSAPVPWGFLVHCLEHGAIDIVYNCPGGCPDEVAQAQTLIDGLGPDGACDGAPMKVVLVPDPSLDVRWAASAWTWTLRATCFDKQAFAAFIAAHYEGPDTESACGGGLDLSASGWCP